METDETLSEIEKRYYIIYTYSERDEEIYNNTGVNTLEFMHQKVNQYSLTPRRSTESIYEIIKQRRFREFYSLFSMADLCVLGY